MSHRHAADQPLSHLPPASTAAARMCSPGAEEAPGDTIRTSAWTRLFPPPDADAETRAAWLAGSPWPEIVFASAR